MALRKIAAALFLCACPAVAEEKAPTTLKVLCWNIHHGVGLDKKLDLPRIAAVIRAQDPDIVALQEVDRGCQRSDKTDQAAILAELTGMKSVFGEAMPYDGGSYGQAILSKHPIQTSRVIRLSNGKEPRIAFQADMLHPVGLFTIVSVHLDYQTPEGRLAEATKLLEAVESIRNPVVVAGDFNDVPDAAPLALFKAPWVRLKANPPAATFPSAAPRKQIDHILQKGFAATGEIVIIDEQIASDHRPITTTLALPAK